MFGEIVKTRRSQFQGLSRGFGVLSPNFGVLSRNLGVQVAVSDMKSWSLVRGLHHVLQGLQSNNY